jgi:hypothetical protein
VIDPVAKRIGVHRRTSDGRMPPVADLSEADTLATPLLPGFSLPLREYFR